MIRRCQLVLCFLCIGGTSYSQTHAVLAPAGITDRTVRADSVQKEKISLKDAKEIAYQAQSTMQVLQMVLNSISSNDNTASGTAEAIANSYKPSHTRVFYDKNIIIEDDLDPQYTLGKTRDVEAEKYLNDLDLKYEKTADESIKFSNLVLSDVKKKDYIYLKVRFDEEFASKFKSNGGTYGMRQREALVRIEHAGSNQWEALVMGISFYNPATPTEAKDYNMQVATDTSATATLISDEEANKAREAYLKQKDEEEKKKQAAFDEYVNMGVTFVANRQYKEGLEAYEKAKELKPLVPSLDKRIIEAKKLNADNTYDNYKSKGDKAKGERRFMDAINFYKQAIVLDPEKSQVLQPEITALNQKIEIISRCSNKLEAGDYEGTIKECKKILSDHKKEKEEFPEIYLIEGQAYEKMAETKQNDRSDLEAALTNINFAIQYFANYKDGRLARADFFIRHKHDLVSAITDYDVLATNELDDSPDKPVYFMAKAKLKDELQNPTGALADYNQAILLSPNNAAAYYNIGELQYRLKTFAEANKNFSTAIKLNPKYGRALYYRGLNFVSTSNNYLAGVDFAEAEKQGIGAPELKTIDSISNVFFVKGKELSDKHDFVNADTAYDNALKIRKCNADALHGKAEMRLITGDEKAASKKPADAKAFYDESIALNRQAIACNPGFSDAHFKEGLAHAKIKEYDLAIASYTNAVKSDEHNVQAYIQRGNTYQIQEKYTKAVDDYNQAITILQGNLQIAKNGSDKLLVKTVTKDLSTANQLNGKAQYYLADYPNAIISLNKAIDLWDTNNEAFYYRGLVYFAQGELSKSGRDMDAAIKITPDYRYYYANGKTNYKNKNYASAISNLSQAITADSLNALSDKYYLRGLCYYKNKQYNEALADYDLYSKVDGAKSDTSFYADYGVTQLMTGKDTAAVLSLKHALTVSPNNARAMYSLGCFYAKTGQYDKAFDLMQKALATHILTKEDIRPEEEALLVEFNKVKANRSRYKDIKNANNY